MLDWEDKEDNMQHGNSVFEEVCYWKKSVTLLKIVMITSIRRRTRPVSVTFRFRPSGKKSHSRAGSVGKGPIVGN